MMRTHKRMAISDMLAVIILLALTIVAGTVVYQVFFNRASTYSSTDSIQINSASISNGVLVLTIQNTGTTAVNSYSVAVYQGGSTVSLSGVSGGGAISPAQTSVYTATGSFTSGASYTVVVTATLSNGGTVEATVSVTAT